MCKLKLQYDTTTQIRMAKSKAHHSTCTGQCAATELSYFAGKNVNWYSGRQFDNYYEVKHTLTLQACNSTSRHLSEIKTSVT